MEQVPLSPEIFPIHYNKREFMQFDTLSGIIFFTFSTI